MDLDIKQMTEMVKILAGEKDLPEQTVIDAVETAIAAAWRRDNGSKDQTVRSELNLNTGKAVVFLERTVVNDDDGYSIYTEIPLKEAKKLKKDISEGDIIEESFEVTSFGRVASATAKQVLISKIKEAERDAVMTEFADKIHTIVGGVVSRSESRFCLVDLGRAEGIMPKSEWVQGEFYRVGQRVKVYIKGIETTDRGAQLLLSRADPEMVVSLFSKEVPEIDGGIVKINAIAREAGRRTKLAVSSIVAGVDPVGAFIGNRGTRIQSVTDELDGNERVDVIEWSEDPAEFIRGAISPAEVVKIIVDEKKKSALVLVSPDQHAIAIGKMGQNVRLASTITGYALSIDVTDEKPAEKPADAKDAKKNTKSVEDSLFEALGEA
jgi:N utilization substance protein A